MAAPIECDFFERPPVLKWQDAVSLGTLGWLSGFVPGEKKSNAVGNSDSITQIGCTEDSTKYSTASTIFSLDIFGEMTCRTTGQFHCGPGFNSSRLDCPIAIHDVSSSW